MTEEQQNSCTDPPLPRNFLSPRSAAATLRAAEELQHALRHNIDSVHNVLTALFLASTALIISPRLEEEPCPSPPPLPPPFGPTIIFLASAALNSLTR